MTQSLNSKDDPKQLSMKQARAGNLPQASHFSSGSVRLSFRCRLGCRCLTDTQTSPGGFAEGALDCRQVGVTTSLKT